MQGTHCNGSVKNTGFRLTKLQDCLISQLGAETSWYFVCCVMLEEGEALVFNGREIWEGLNTAT